MELFEQIRREYEHGVGTIKGVAQKFGIHRRMVREAIESAVPKPRKKAEREKPKMAVVIPWIEEILEADQKAPRKQRHTAHRLWCRLKAERPEADVGESTVREYVRKRKIELGLEHGEIFVPQTYHWGQEGRGTGQSLCILLAEHGQRWGVSPGLSARQPAGVSGSTRAGVRLFWRRV